MKWTRWALIWGMVVGLTTILGLASVHAAPIEIKDPEKGVNICTVYEDQSHFTKRQALDLVSCIMLPCYEEGKFYIEFINLDGEREFMDYLRCKIQRTITL